MRYKADGKEKTAMVDAVAAVLLADKRFSGGVINPGRLAKMRARRIVDGMVGVLKTQLMMGGGIDLQGFGSFSARYWTPKGCVLAGHSRRGVLTFSSQWRSGG